MQDDNLGYILYPKAYPHAPGFPQLDIALTDTPTLEHFDPERIHLSVVARSGDVAAMTVSHPWHGEAHDIRVCAGRILLRDREYKRVEFFTLGGSMRILSEDNVTICQITSPAPIIELTLERCVPELLAEEIEALLAMRRAALEAHPHEFENRLACAEPLALYGACLLTLQTKFQRTYDDLTAGLVHFLCDEVAWLREGAPHALAAPSLDQII